MGVALLTLDNTVYDYVFFTLQVPALDMACLQKAVPVARVLLQQCLSARLLLQPATETQHGEFLEVG